MSRLVTAFIYDSFSYYRSQGFSIEECIEFDIDETIEVMIKSLEACGLTVVPVRGIKQLVSMLAEGKHESWDLAFPTAEGMYGAGREAQVPGLLEAYQIPHVFSDAATLSLSHDKGRTKMVLEHMGISTAPFAIVHACSAGSKHIQPVIAEALAKSRHADLMKFPLFIKPACEGSSKGIYPSSKVQDMTQLEDGVRELHSRYPDQDLLIEPFLGGAEYSVTIIGTGMSARVIGTIQVAGKAKEEPSASVGGYSYGVPFRALSDPTAEKGYTTQFVSAEGNPEVQQAEDLALRAWRALDGRDTGRVDLRWGLDGVLYVLEINAIPGMRPGRSIMALTAESIGMSHEQMIGAVLESALDRYPHLKSRHQSAR
ncbi:hypothetical protein B0I37DRAFT_309727 [Chaetomium sp. MPI-CAGE-AT-0009]|nr:hypothetical protein B0I37DRAFT_309727 [Chaetomium sp. MPI-CAGE-AT-0009]